MPNESKTITRSSIQLKIEAAIPLICLRYTFNRVCSWNHSLLKCAQSISLMIADGNRIG